MVGHGFKHAPVRVSWARTGLPAVGSSWMRMALAIRVTVWGAASPVVSPLSFALGSFGFDLFFLFFNYENNFLEMQKITCSQLKIKLAEIKDLKNEFDLEVEKIIQTRNTEHALAIQKKIEEKLTATKEKIFPKEIKAIFTNPETNEQKEIVFNIKEKIKEAQEFYKNHNLPIPKEQEIKKIFRGRSQKSKEIQCMDMTIS